jgi:hypothetical protein
MAAELGSIGAVEDSGAFQMLVGLKKRNAVPVTFPTPGDAVGGAVSDEGVAGTDAVSGTAVTSGGVDVVPGAIVGEVGCPAAGDLDFPVAGIGLVNFVRLAFGALRLVAFMVWRWRVVCRF